MDFEKNRIFDSIIHIEGVFHLKENAIRRMIDEFGADPRQYMKRKIVPKHAIFAMAIQNKPTEEVNRIFEENMSNFTLRRLLGVEIDPREIERNTYICPKEYLEKHLN